MMQGIVDLLMGSDSSGVLDAFFIARCVGLLLVVEMMGCILSSISRFYR